MTRNPQVKRYATNRGSFWRTKSSLKGKHRETLKNIFSQMNIGTTISSMIKKQMLEKTKVAKNHSITSLSHQNSWSFSWYLDIQDSWKICPLWHRKEALSFTSLTSERILCMSWDIVLEGKCICLIKKKRDNS